MTSPADDRPPMTSGRRWFRRIQVAIYLGLSIGMIIYQQVNPGVGTMVVLTYLLAFYMAARALAVFLAYRRESSPPRYSESYIRADDLFTPPSDSTNPDENKNGSPHG